MLRSSLPPVQQNATRPLHAGGACMRVIIRKQCAAVGQCCSSQRQWRCWSMAMDGSDGMSDDSTPSTPDELRRAAARFEAMVTPQRFTGKQLRELVYQKWGRTYDVRLQKVNGRLFCQVMWKCLEMKSFHLKEEEYMAQLDAVCEYLQEWNVVEVVRAGITNASSRGPGYTQGGGARCISIPLNVDLSAARKGEWR